MHRRIRRTPEREGIVTLHIDVEKAINPAPAQNKPRILLLEDRADFRRVLHDYLARTFQVTSVPSGVEGVREIMKTPFDLILCDMMMPSMNGEMFYWAVTRVRPAAGQRFIFFTGHVNNAPIEFFFRRIDAVVLRKPFALSALDAAIASVVRKLA